MNKTFVKLLGLICVATSLTACTGSYSGGNGGGGGPYYTAWYDVYGTYCSNSAPRAGCNFYANGTKITASNDPYYYNMTLYYDYWTYTDSYGYSRSYNGYAWLSNDGILYDQYGNALNEQDSSEQSADVIALAAALEQKTAVQAGKILAQKYALSEDQGVIISKTLQDWATLGRDRARTSDDISDFATRLYGIDPVKAKNALTTALSTQSQQPLEDLNADVAAHWGTSPETSKIILKSWYKDEVAAYGIK
jgi:hypothetical protein